MSQQRHIEKYSILSGILNLCGIPDNSHVTSPNKFEIHSKPGKGGVFELVNIGEIPILLFLISDEETHVVWCNDTGEIKSAAKAVGLLC